MEFRLNADKQNYRLCFANFDLPRPGKPDVIIFQDSEQHENITTLFIEYCKKVKEDIRNPLSLLARVPGGHTI